MRETFAVRLCRLAVALAMLDEYVGNSPEIKSVARVRSDCARRYSPPKSPRWIVLSWKSLIVGGASMSHSPQIAQRAPAPFVSTGQLPSPEVVDALVKEAHERFKSNTQGQNSQVYPALARAKSNLFGVCVVGTSGNVYAVGDSDVEFTIMSVSKPFILALVSEVLGPDEVRDKVGVNATGRAFNSLEGIERGDDGRTNPMVNSGAIATTSLVPGKSFNEKWEFIYDGLSRFAGRRLSLNDEVYASASETNFRNQSIARMLQSFGRIYLDPTEATDLYTKQCSLNVSAKDLAVMSATLADGGVNPITKQRVVDPPVCHYALAVMATAGLYETSGDWLYEIGLPGKSGIGGGIATVSPGKGGLGTFAPPLDKAGNSIKGQLVAKFLSERLGMDLFVSKPEV
jgi:glutaminase